jgi:Glycosyltransferase family 87
VLKITKLAILTWAILALYVVFYTDLTLEPVLANSDFLTNFYTAGKIAQEKCWEILYPAQGAAGFADEAFNAKAHALLPFMPSYSVAEYMYMPLSAYVFAPFALLGAKYSLIAWQIVSLGALWVSAWLVSLAQLRRMATGRWQRPAMAATLASAGAMTFLPLVNQVWIGQVSLVFGLLPLCFTYLCASLGQYVWAGAAAGLLLLKPQLLIPAFFIMAGRLALKKIDMACGFAIMVILILSTNYLVFGGEIMQSWLDCVRLSDKVFSDTSQGIATTLATSLPRAVLLAYPVESHAWLKPLLYVFAALAGLGGMAVGVLQQKRGATNPETVDCLFLLGLLALPVVVPHMFFYDLAILLPFYFIIFSSTGYNQFNPNLYFKLRAIGIFDWIAVNAYFILLIVDKKYAQPLILVTVFLMLYVRAAAAYAKQTQSLDQGAH